MTWEWQAIFILAGCMYALALGRKCRRTFWSQQASTPACRVQHMQDWRPQLPTGTDMATVHAAW